MIRINTAAAVPHARPQLGSVSAEIAALRGLAPDREAHAQRDADKVAA